jgi:hypothetical protein
MCPCGKSGAIRRRDTSREYRTRQGGGKPGIRESESLPSGISVMNAAFRAGGRWVREGNGAAALESQSIVLYKLFRCRAEHEFAIIFTCTICARRIYVHAVRSRRGLGCREPGA